MRLVGLNTGNRWPHLLFFGQFSTLFHWHPMVRRITMRKIDRFLYVARKGQRIGLRRPQKQPVHPDLEVDEEMFSIPGERRTTRF